MNLKQLEYVVAIAEYGNISKAADSLFITQSGLNQQLIKLERELGLQLFFRNNHSLHMTQAGKIYVANAKEILHIKKNAYTQLNDLKGNIARELHLGLTHEHGIDLFTSVFPQFNSKYPGVTFKLKEALVAHQHDLLQKGELDFGIVMLNSSERINLEYTPLFHEELVIGVSKNHPLAQHGSAPGTHLSTIDLREFKDEKFSLIFHGSTMRKVLQYSFDTAGFQPQILVETAMNHALVKMVNIGYCCTIIPHSRALATAHESENVVWFYLTSHPAWDVCIARRSDTQLGIASRYFIQLAKEYGYELQSRFL